MVKTNDKSKFDELLKDPNTTTVVIHPDDIQKLINQGLVQEKFITYEEYVNTLYEERKNNAVELLKKLPKIDKSIADGVISNIYEEIRSSYAFGVFTSTIFNSILLLEYSMRSRLYKERLKHNPKAEWSMLERLDMGGLIPQLKKCRVIDKDESSILDDFSKNLRNPYLHFNIYKLVDGIAMKSLPSLNIATQKMTGEIDVDAKKYRFVWFSAKQFFDRERVQDVINFCVHWTNKLLTTV